MTRLGSRQVYTFFAFFVILRYSKLEGGWYLIKVRDFNEKDFNEVFLYNQRKDVIYGMCNPKWHVL